MRALRAVYRHDGLVSSVGLSGLKGASGGGAVSALRALVPSEGWLMVGVLKAGWVSSTTATIPA